MTGVAWHEVNTGDNATIRRWAPTYPGTPIVRHRRRATSTGPAVASLWRRWHTQPPAWADRLITAGLAVLTLLGGTLAAGAMA